MTYMLINAVKEQQLIIDKQQQQIDHDLAGPTGKQAETLTDIAIQRIHEQERQPQDTRSGGWLGFLTFVSELSKTYSISSVVPAGTQNGVA